MLSVGILLTVLGILWERLAVTMRRAKDMVVLKQITPDDAEP